MDHAIIDYYLIYRGQREKTRKHIESFLENIVDTIDVFLPILDKIIYYGYRDIALEVSLDCYKRVKGAKVLITGIETDFFKVICIEKL